MKRAKKLIFAVIAIVVLLVVVAVIWIDKLAKTGIETGSTYALGTETTLDKASVGIVSGQSSLAGLTVANPPGFDANHFVQLQNGGLDVSIASLASDTVEVPNLSITGIDLNLERKGLKSNYDVIMDNLGRFESSEDTQSEAKAGKKFVIREILIRDVKVNVNLSPVVGTPLNVTVPISEIRLTDVGSDSDKGVIIAQLADTLLKAIFAATVEQGEGLIPADVLGQLDSRLKQLDSLAEVGASLATDAIKQLDESAQNIANQVTNEATKQVQEGLGKLLQPQKTPENERAK